MTPQSPCLVPQELIMVVLMPSLDMPTSPLLGSQLGVSAQSYTSALLHPVGFGAALALSLVGHFWIPVLALPLGFVTKDFAVYVTDFLPW